MRISDWSSDVCSSDLTGDSNSATVNQDTSTFAVQSTSYIEQSGDSNTADVTQVDDWQSSSVVQSSDGNSATVSQGDATAALTDDRYGNTSTLNHAGSGRSEERRVGKECVSTGRSRWSQDHEKHKPYTANIAIT